MLTPDLSLEAFDEARLMLLLTKLMELSGVMFRDLLLISTEEELPTSMTETGWTGFLLLKSMDVVGLYMR